MLKLIDKDYAVCLLDTCVKSDFPAAVPVITIIKILNDHFVKLIFDSAQIDSL